MSRHEDFDKASVDYADKIGAGRISRIVATEHYYNGCEHGYQYAVEKACEWLQCLEHELGYMCIGDFINSFRKAMEE